jgi:hypothetical protein
MVNKHFIFIQEGVFKEVRSSLYLFFLINKICFHSAAPAVKGVFLNLAAKLALASRLRTHHSCKSVRFTPHFRSLMIINYNYEL